MTYRDPKNAAYDAALNALQPFNPAADEMLRALGYTRQRIEADWEDAGDAENGPDLHGHPAFDEYTDGTCFVYVGEDGDTGFEMRDLEMENFQCRLCDDACSHPCKGER
jgi:hypothetical protein